MKRVIVFFVVIVCVTLIGLDLTGHNFEADFEKIKGFVGFETASAVEEETLKEAFQPEVLGVVRTIPEETRAYLESRGFKDWEIAQWLEEASVSSTYVAGTRLGVDNLYNLKKGEQVQVFAGEESLGVYTVSVAPLKTETGILYGEMTLLSEYGKKFIFHRSATFLEMENHKWLQYITLHTKRGGLRENCHQINDREFVDLYGNRLIFVTI